MSRQLFRQRCCAVRALACWVLDVQTACSAQYLVALSRRYPRYWLGDFVRFDGLQGASFAARPMVRTQQYFAAGVVISWLLGESATRVVTHD